MIFFPNLSASTQSGNNLAKKTWNVFIGKNKPREHDEEKKPGGQIPTVPTGSTGDSNIPSGIQNDQIDSKVSEHVNKGPSYDEVSAVANLANMGLLYTQQLFEGQSHEGSNISSQEKSVDQISQKENCETRRFSLPPCLSPQEPATMMQPRPQSSEPFLCKMEQKRKLQLADPLAISLLNNLELLEGLGKSLDKEYSWNGEIKCWKHLAEYFGIEATIYEDFTRYQERSPTEDLFEFLNTHKPKEFTVGKLKEKLRSIDRQNVEEVLVKHQKHQNVDNQITDETQVGSLFDSHPAVIGEIEFLLDKETQGTKNWKQLADEFGVPRSDSDSFGDAVDDNPTEKLFQYLKVKQPRLTIGEVKKHLKDFKMDDVLEVITNSKRVKDNSPLKEIWEDLTTAERVFNLLNKKHTSMTRRWRFLGNKLGVKKDVLDLCTKEGEEEISPTAVLINHLSGAKPNLVMANLIWALDKISRSDVFFVVEPYLPDGFIPKFLESAKASLAKQQQQTAPIAYKETEIN